MIKKSEQDIIAEAIRSFVTESKSYKEIEFVCHNCKYPNSTSRDKQKALHQDLKNIHGVIPLHQDWSDETQTQHSLTAIYKTSAHRKAILAAAKKHGVEVDLERGVEHDYVDRAIKGKHENQVLNNK